MAVGADTIQTLLRQRQDLREALLELRQEIQTLDASSLDLVNKNIKSPTSVAANAKKEAITTASSENQTATTDEPPVKAEPTLTASTPVTPETTSDMPNSDTETEARAAPATPIPEGHPATSSKIHQTSSKSSEAESQPKVEQTGGPLSHDTGSKNGISEFDRKSLQIKARNLSEYFQGHPSPATGSEMIQLEAAISANEFAKTPEEKQQRYHALQSIYREVASKSFASLGINGTTVRDSRKGSRLLWALPLCIAVLVAVIFPLLVLVRALADEMFTKDFAADMVWVIWAVSAFLWGAVGALTVLTLNIALLIRRRQYDAAVKQSPGLRAGLGGLMGCAFFLLPEVWLPSPGVSAAFALNLAAFIGGVLSWVIFAALQRIIHAIVRKVEPDFDSSEQHKATKK